MTSRLWILVLGILCCFRAAAALAQAGHLDPNFANGGVLRAGFGTSHRTAGFGIAAQSDGKLVVAGETTIGNAGEFVLLRYNTDGSLDPSFGDGGKVLTSFGCGSEGANAVAIQPDGKILAAGFSSTAIAVARYQPNGSLDSSWDGDGRATFTGSGELRANAIALQANGKVVVAGSQFDTEFHYAVARFNADGSPDTSFDGDGLVVTPFFPLEPAWANALAIQVDGKILAVGQADDNDGTHLAMARYLDNGALDTTFDLDGKTILVEKSEGRAVSLMRNPSNPSQNGIVVAGQVDIGSKFAVYFFDFNGSLDTSFGTNGQVTNIPGIGEATAVRVLTSFGAPTGILAAGTASGIVVAKYLLDGTPDTAFGGGDGFTVTDVSANGEDAYAMTVSSGKIAVTGRARTPTPYWDLAVLRYNSDGTLDTAFDGDGIRIEDPSGRVSEARAIALQPDGRIVVAGSTQSAAGDEDFALLRCSVAGALDPSFGQGGRVTTPVGSGNDIIHAVAMQADGKIVVAGQTNVAANTEIVVARYNPNGSLDTSFSGDGIAVVPMGPGADQGKAVAVQPDGRIVVAGSIVEGFTTKIAVLRFLADGTLELILTSPAGGDGAYATCLALQPDGKVLVAGSGSFGVNQSIVCGRVLPGWTFDPSFDGDGIVITPIAGDFDRASAVMVRNDGRIVVAGSSFDGQVDRVVLVRYHSDGSLDTSFSGDGIVTFEAASGDISGAALGQQPNGKLVVAGSASEPGRDFALLRFQDDGSPDLSYGTGGLVLVDLDQGSIDAAEAMAIDAQGNATVAGTVCDLFGVIRVLGDPPTSDTWGDFEPTAGLRLGMPWPNPTPGGTSVDLDLAAPGAVAVAVFDVAGHLVRTLGVEVRLGAGIHPFHWDGRSQSGTRVSSGVYLLQARRNGEIRTRRITVMR